MPVEYEMPVEEEAEVDVPAEEPASDFDMFADEALGIPPGDPTGASKRAALKEAIIACLEEHEGGGYEGGAEKKPAKEGKEGLALVFGGG